MMDVDEDTDLGPCCYCETTGPRVRNIFMIELQCLIPGHGWGCVVCNLPCNGASYVLCDDCFDLERKPKFACRGYPGIDGRCDIKELTVPFSHDFAKHEND